MQKKWLAGVGAAALVTMLAGTAVIAQQGSPRTAPPPQAAPADRGGAPWGRWFDFAADEPEQDLRLFEDYADDQDDEPRRSAGGGEETGQGGGSERGERERSGAERRGEGGGRGYYGRDDGPPRGMMMGRRGFGGLCGPQGGRIVEAMLFRLERIVEPTEAQRGAFDRLKQAAARAREIAQAGCPTERAMTPPGRLAAAEKRLEAMLEAIRTVRPAMDELFAQLNEEQKARIYAAAARAQMRRERWRAWRERWREHGYGHHRGGWRDGGGPGYGRDGYGRGGRGYGRDDGDDDGRSGRRRGGRDDDRDGWPDPWRGRL